MTIEGFDALIHAPVRLQICAILSATDEAEFALVRQETGVSESVLSKHVRQLEGAGYVKVRKAVLQSRQRTWLSLSDSGQAAFSRHLRTLARLASSAGQRPLAATNCP